MHLTSFESFSGRAEIGRVWGVMKPPGRVVGWLEYGAGTGGGELLLHSRKGAEN